jgi:hypothetical protein
MLPITPTSDWIVANNRRRIVSPGDKEDEPSGVQGLNNNNNNQFSSLEDSDSDDDESISSTSTASSVIAIETDAAFPIDTGATDHLIGAVEQAIQAQRIRQVLGGDPITATDTSAFKTAARFIEAGETEFNRLYQDSDLGSDTASTASSSTASASVSSYGSMGQDTLPSIDDYLRKEYQTAAKSNFNFADAVVFREELGNALAACQHTTRDAGHAYMVDTAKRHCERYGDAIAILPPPAEKVLIPAGNSIGEWRRYDILKKIYE